MLKILCVLVLLLGTGCASPIGVTRVGIDQGYRQITDNALTGSTLSDDTRAVLHRHELWELYRSEPDEALKRLYSIACQDSQRELLFALAEASYAAARKYEDSTWVRVHGTMVSGTSASRLHDFAAAVYAYLYLFSADAKPALFDPHARIACSIYNFGLAKALKRQGSNEIELSSRSLQLPMGSVAITTSRAGFPWTEDEFSRFVASDEYIVRGLTSRNREYGLGVPLISIRNQSAVSDKSPSYFTKNVKLPATAFLKVHESLRDMTGDGLKATLELHCTFNVMETEVNGQKVPLEADLTAPVAYALEGSDVWHTEVSQFLSGQQFIKTSVYLTQPYEPGKIPIVFVHGTGGSPGRWAEMFNTLKADPMMRRRYQFWYFIYNSGQPIPYSAMLFRESLDEVVKHLDPQGSDPALRQMVVIGHSQGGLITRMAVVQSGDRLIQSWTDRKLDDFKMSPETRSIFERGAYFEPSPYIQRVIFMCTPHRGSYRVSNIVKRLTAFLVKMPGDVFRAGTELVAGNPHALPRELSRGFPTSVAAMKPGSAFLDALAEMPF
jgi:pimeloyl-ACP methyl ester carboxylesterase